MAANATLFVAMPFDEFQELIQNTIKNELKKFSIVPQPTPQDDLMSIEDAGALLHVSKVTIHKWKKKKLIQAYRIGRKIYFKRRELIEAINSTVLIRGKTKVSIN
ncbi:helix-turn-helix domain-containing protein [Ferruginibacter sp. SUN106]|uniref:helix-turn-helix domain-containing protein n=1 Tax=Ferruginibacter sp. SUN106 TaxID=2978348 RepID=UPI003D36332B